MGGFGFPPVEHGEYSAPVPAGAAVFELRPLSTGEILDRTFALYRRRFWLYVGLSSVAAAVTTLTTFVQITAGTIGRAPVVNADGAAVMHQAMMTLVVLLPVSLVHLLAYAVTQAAAVSAVEASYLGRETSIGGAFRAVRGKWYRYLGVALWQGWSIVWPMMAVMVPAAILAAIVGQATGGRAAGAVVVVVMLLLMLPAFVLGFIFYLRNSLGIVACVSERLTVRQSMKRSKFLVADHKTRAFLLYLLMVVLALAVGVLQTLFNVFLIKSHGAVRAGVEMTTLLVTFLSGALVQPVGAIAFVLFYIDQRVRKEGFDVEMLLEQVSGVPAPAREMESPFSSGLGVAEGAGSSPFSSGPSPGSSPFGAAPPAADSPFSSGPLPGSSDAERHG